jgi:hypothetical protein
MATLAPQPPVNLKLVDSQGVPANYWQGYLVALDMVARALAANKVGPLTNAVNDAAAAAAGVPVGALYRNGNAVQIRVV